MRLMQLVLVCTLAGIPAACGPSKPASVITGECRVFTAPAWPVQGRTARDQGWIDDQVESGIAACGWLRPKLEPAAAPAAKRPGLLHRVLGRKG